MPVYNGANKQLSNLVTTAINTSLISDNDNTDDLGSLLKAWNNTYSNKVYTTVLAPHADGTTALQINKADGTTNVLNVDTTNSRIGIGSTPTDKLDVSGGIRLTSNATFDASLTGRIQKNATFGLTFQGVAGSTADWTLLTPGGTRLLENPTGTTNFVFGTTGAVNVGIGISTPTSILDIQKAGTAKGNLDILELTNSTNVADMDNTQTSILFNQWYYHASVPGVTAAGRITVGTESDWTPTGSTIDAYMAFKVTVDNTVTERVRITSAGNFLVGVTACDTTAVKAIGIGNGTAPAGSVADMIHIFSTDIVGGDATLGLRLEAVVAAETDETKFSDKLPVKINGTTYYIMLTQT